MLFKARELIRAARPRFEVTGRVIVSIFGGSRTENTRLPERGERFVFRIADFTDVARLV
jgi:hypothetical protein